MAEFECTIRTLPVDDGGGDAAPIEVQATTLSVLNEAYWGPEVRVIPVSFLDVGDRGTIDMILSHMNAWGCGVSFAWSQSGGWVRITTGAGGYWSYLGRQILQVPPGEPTMNLQQMGLWTPEAERRRVIRHETGHTLGFPHEHLRAEFVSDINPALAYAYYRQTQGWGRALVDANVLRSLASASITGTPPDGDSILAYPIPGSITYSGRPIAGGADINETDRRFARTIYPQAAPGPAPEPEPPPPPPPPPEVADVGPYDLSMGRPSPPVKMEPGKAYLFRFRPRGHRSFVAGTTGDLALEMSLHGDDGGRPGAVLKADDEHAGLAGNALLAFTLRPGVYYLRVAQTPPEVEGRFRVKVTAT